MSFVLGFGSSEKEKAYFIINQCYEAIKENQDNAEKSIQKIQKEYKDADEKYHSMEASEVPERYAYFYFSFHKIYTDRYFIEFSFHHINRRHPMSPDGWALLVTHWALSVNEDEKIIYTES